MVKDIFFTFSNLVTDQETTEVADLSALREISLS